MQFKQARVTSGSARKPQQSPFLKFLVAGVRPVIGLGLLAFYTRSASLERTRHLRCSIATSTLKGSPCHKQHIHVYVKEEEWEVLYRFVTDGKDSVLAIICTDISRRSKSRASLVQRRLSSFFVFHQSVLKLVVELPMTVDLSLIVAAMTDVDTCGLTFSKKKKLDGLLHILRRRPHRVNPLFHDMRNCHVDKLLHGALKEALLANNF